MEEKSEARTCAQGPKTKGNPATRHRGLWPDLRLYCSRYLYQRSSSSDRSESPGQGRLKGFASADEILSVSRAHAERWRPGIWQGMGRSRQALLPQSQNQPPLPEE